MATNLALDDKLIELALKIGHHNTKKDAVTAALKDYVAHLILCLQSSYSLSRGLAHDRVEVRIASVLSSLALKFAKSSPADGSYTIKFTRHVLADITGTTTETAIRVTRAMQRAGLIDIKLPGVIRILNQKALSEIVEA